MIIYFLVFKAWKIQITADRPARSQIQFPECKFANVTADHGIVLSKTRTSKLAGRFCWRFSQGKRWIRPDSYWRRAAAANHHLVRPPPSQRFISSFHSRPLLSTAVGSQTLLLNRLTLLTHLRSYNLDPEGPKPAQTSLWPSSFSPEAKEDNIKYWWSCLCYFNEHFQPCDNQENSHFISKPPSRQSVRVKKTLLNGGLFLFIMRLILFRGSHPVSDNANLICEGRFYPFCIFRTKQLEPLFCPKKKLKTETWLNLKHVFCPSDLFQLINPFTVVSADKFLYLISHSN